MNEFDEDNLQARRSAAEAMARTQEIDLQGTNEHERV